MDQKFDIDVSVDSAIRETERYYREQIFSSGCSSLVPIYRIGDHTNKVESLLQQFQGSPYIQKDAKFSAKVIETLLDVNLYKYDNYHFFFQGDMQGEIQQFIEEQCQQVASFTEVVRQDFSDTQPKWSSLETDVDNLLKDFPVMSGMPLNELLQQILEIVREINLHHSVESCLEAFHQETWRKKVKVNQTSLFCMVAVANKLGWNQQQLKNLVMLSLLKDIGYARLNEQIQDFEVLHPLVSHKLVTECNKLAEGQNKVPQEVINAILVHHEFTDGSGPLGRMRHPLVMKLLGDDMPEAAQVSGLCDLFFGILKDYSPGIAFSIACGFVLGQGELQSRYSSEIIHAFSDVIRQGACDTQDIQEDEADKLINGIFNLLRDPQVRKNAAGVVNAKTTSWYERITLSLNIVRNIARRQPEHIGEGSLVNTLHLPAEFGLNY